MPNLNQQIDRYIMDLFCPNAVDLNFVFENMARHGLPDWSISPNEGKLLYLLAKLCGATKILEFGALGGYSTIWLAKALPEGGKLISLEYSPKHVQVARENVRLAGLGEKVEIRQGAALDLLPQIEAGGEAPFDMFFIDADKPNNANYVEWAIKLARPGSLILTDNVIWNGAVINANLKGSDDYAATARFNQNLAAHPRLESLIMPLIRGNVDGLAVSLVK